MLDDQDTFGNLYWDGEKLQHDIRKFIKHREDGPAFIGVNGSEHWYINGKLHREDGPAITRLNGEKEWWNHGKLRKIYYERLTDWWPIHPLALIVFIVVILILASLILVSVLWKS